MFRHSALLMHLLLIVPLLLALIPQRSECSSRGFPHPLKVIRGVLQLPGLVLGKTGEVCKNDGSGCGNNKAADGIISGEESAEKGKGNDGSSSGNGDCCYSGLDVEELVAQRSLRALEKQTARVGRALMITADTFAGVAGGALKAVGATGRRKKKMVVEIGVACGGLVIYFFII